MSRRGLDERRPSGQPRARVRLASTLSLVVLVLGLGQLLLQGILFLAVWIRSVAAGESTDAAIRVVTTEPLALGVAQLVGLGAVLALGHRVLLPKRSLADAIGLAPGAVVPTHVLALSFVAGLAIQLPLVELMNVLQDLVPALARAPERDEAVRAVVRIDGPVRAFSVPFAVVLVPAVTEELLFRGVVFGRLRELVPVPAAVVLVALLFGAFHLEPLAFVYASSVGLVLGVLTARAPSVLPAIALHAGFNALPVLLPVEIVAIDGFNTPANAHVPWWLALASASVATLSLVLAMRAMPPSPPSTR